MCVYMCIYIYIYIYMHTHIHTCATEQQRTDKCPRRVARMGERAPLVMSMLCMYRSLSLSLYIHIYIYIYMCLSIYLSI